MNSRADIFLLYSIIENILKTAESPAEFGNYLSEQIKSIIGVKTVIVYSYDEIDNQFQSLAVCPKRNKNFFDSKQVLSFISNFVGETQNMYLELGDNSPYQKGLKSLELKNALVIPLALINHFEGLILLCDLYDNHNIANVIDAFTKISSLAAIVLRNSKLFNNLEKNVEKRTEELSKKNQEYELLNKELLLAKERAEESETRFKALHNASFGGIAVHDKGLVLEVNQGMSELTGYSIDELIGMDGLMLIADDYRDLVMNNIITAYEEPYEAKGLRKNGDTYPLRIEAREIPYKGKRARVVEFRDITERKKQEEEIEKYKSHLESLVKERTDELQASIEEIRATNEELYAQRDALENTIKRLNDAQTKLVQSEKMASLGVLVAGVAHEINNPVNFINSSLSGLKNNLDYLSDFVNFYQEIDETNYKLILEALKEKEASLPDVFNMFRKSIEIIEIGVQRTTKIVKGLQSFARADEKELARYNLHENIDNTLLILHHQYKERIKIEKEYGDVPFILCYPGQINQVLMNILTNAVHSINKEGIIKITTYSCEKDKIEIKIKDSGEGIHAENMKRIFDPFFTTKEVGKGTGLGLSISYNIIKDHKGEIFVESKVGKGSCFRIILPVKQ